MEKEFAWMDKLEESADKFDGVKAKEVAAETDNTPEEEDIEEEEAE